MRPGHLPWAAGQAAAAFSSSGKRKSRLFVGGKGGPRRGISSLSKARAGRDPRLELRSVLQLRQPGLVQQDGCHLLHSALPDPPDSLDLPSRPAAPTASGSTSDAARLPAVCAWVARVWPHRLFKVAADCPGSHDPDAPLYCSWSGCCAPRRWPAEVPAEADDLPHRIHGRFSHPRADIPSFVDRIVGHGGQQAGKHLERPPEAKQGEIKGRTIQVAPAADEAQDPWR